MIRAKIRASHLVIAAVLLLAAYPAMAQESPGAISLPGRVIGPAGESLAGQVVVLHRVTDVSGATVATDTTGADGRFLLEADDTADASVGTYFVASRYQGELYIGAPFQFPVPEGIDYTVQVGVPGTSASVLMGEGGGSAAPPVMPRNEPFPYARWLFLVIPLLVVALVAGYMLTRRQQPQTRRRLLAQVAELDEIHDTELAAGRIDDSTLYWAERRALLEQLTRVS